MRLTPVVFAIVALVPAFRSSAAPVLLAQPGKPGAVIVLPDKPIAPEKSAAAELQRCLLKSVGARLPILVESQARAGKPRILVGQCRMVRSLWPGLDVAKLGADGIALRTVGRDLILTGGRPRGVYYAVCEFLEKVVGYRWWDESTETAPKLASLALPQLNTTYVPQIVCREPHFYLPNHSPEWCAHNRANGHFNTVPPSLGGNMRILGWCHTFFQLLPPDKYFAQHPEWYSEIGGSRKAADAQLCLSNPEVVEEISARALDWIRKEPDAGFISIAQNDWYGRCECAKCKAAEAEEGSASGPLVRFVNQVAERIEREYPSFMVETLAYQWSRHAPKLVKPRKNVVIRLCSIECDYGLPLTDPRNAAFLTDLHEWSAIAPHLYIWTYIAAFGEYWYPNPCLPTYGPNIRQFAANKALGVFMQGDSYNAASCFARLRSWVIARLLWNPQLDEAKLVDEFLAGYYGPAAPHLKAYLALVDRSYANRNGRKPFTPEVTLEGFRLFDAAMKSVAGKPELLARVRRERFPLEYLWVVDHRRLLRAAQAAGGPLPGPVSLAESAEALRAKAEAEKSIFRAEGQEGLVWLKALSVSSKVPAARPPSLEGVAKDRIIDLQEGDMRLFNQGSWVDVVDDPAASNTKAARLRTDHTQWAVQADLPEDVGPKVHLYIAIRAEGDEPAATACTVGVYDAAKGANLVGRSLTVAEIGGADFKLIDLGEVATGGSPYLYVAPQANSPAVKSVSVDRILVVK